VSADLAESVFYNLPATIRCRRTRRDNAASPPPGSRSRAGLPTAQVDLARRPRV